ncbi:hypothetical protein EYC59_04030 [Candidatus Saccharibacteria bacterium]|nr:MAG: hypothetical protein EYC59_04030 [Candidatus Saccharibacteria bacterium]
MSKHEFLHPHDPAVLPLLQSARQALREQFDWAYFVEGPRKSSIKVFTGEVAASAALRSPGERRHEVNGGIWPDTTGLQRHTLLSLIHTTALWEPGREEQTSDSITLTGVDCGLQHGHIVAERQRSTTVQFNPGDVFGDSEKRVETITKLGAIRDSEHLEEFLTSTLAAVALTAEGIPPTVEAR